jgi:pimeloyl-ACP methyl ester carboxylesterase
MREVLVTMVNESYDDELRRLSVPLHLVWGALDDAVAVGVAESVRTLVPTATLEVISGVGHDTVRDAPEVLARVVGSIQ